jgi:hypothetical protein
MEMGYDSDVHNNACTMETTKNQSTKPSPDTRANGVCSSQMGNEKIFDPEMKSKELGAAEAARLITGDK